MSSLYITCQEVALPESVDSWSILQLKTFDDSSRFNHVEYEKAISPDEEARHARPKQTNACKPLSELVHFERYS